MKNIFKIRFCEPYFANSPVFSHTFDFDVNENFYNILKSAPSSSKKCDNGNFYTFGPQFPLSEYVKIATQTPSVLGQISLIDITNATEKELSNIADPFYIEYEEWYLDLAYKYNNNWDDKDLFQEMKNKLSNKIIFLGEVRRGNIPVGADLYAHYSDDDMIDGLIIENNCLFATDQTGGSSSMKYKYLKYKRKYLALKNKLV